MTDKHFTRKSNLVFPSFVLISKQSNTNPGWHSSCAAPVPGFCLERMSHLTSLLGRKLRDASCGFECQITLLAIEQRHGAFTFFFPVNVLFFVTGQLNSFTELLHCSQRWLQHELATATGKQRHEIQYNSSFAYIHQVPNVLRQYFVKFMLPIHPCYCLKVAQPGLHTLHSCLWCSVDISSGLVWIRISVMIVAE